MLITLYLIGTTLLFKALGFAREVLVAQFYGTGPVTDAYVIANSIPTVLIQAWGQLWRLLLYRYLPEWKMRRERFGLRNLLYGCFCWCFLSVP